MTSQFLGRYDVTSGFGSPGPTFVKYRAVFGRKVSDNIYYCCRKTAVCIGDQLLNFSLPELVRSQSTFNTDPEVLQNCPGFTLCSSAGLAVGICSAVMGLTPCLLCVQIYCVVCIGLLSAEFSAVNTGLGRPMFCKPLCLLSTPEGLATTNYQLT